MSGPVWLRINWLVLTGFEMVSRFLALDVVGCLSSCPWKLLTRVVCLASPADGCLRFESLGHSMLVTSLPRPCLAQAVLPGLEHNVKFSSLSMACRACRSTPAGSPCSTFSEAFDSFDGTVLPNGPVGTTSLGAALTALLATTPRTLPRHRGPLLL
jgi:hypothetical protein